MYKKAFLSNYELDKFKVYTSSANSRFEVSKRFKIKKLKNVDFLFNLSKVVNDTKELKLSVINGEIIEFNMLNPAYVLEKNQEIVNTFTNYSSNYEEFVRNYEKDYELFLQSPLAFSLKQSDINCFYVSSFKGYFDSFSLHLKNGFEFYQPIFTSLKDSEELVIYANFHHAFFDLARAKKFYDYLAELLK